MAKRSDRFSPPREWLVGAKAAARTAVVTAAVTATALGGSAVALADDVTNLAKELASMRSDVESISTELSSKRGELDNELKSLARQKAELEAERQREQVRLTKIRQLVGGRKAEIGKRQAEEAKLRPAFDAALAEVRAYVQASMPFRRQERLSELGKIEEQLKSGLLTPERGLSRLWSFVEDEFRLTSESGVYRQTVSMDGKDQLADVVRLGMVGLYFRTADGQYGHAVHGAGGAWAFASLEGKEERQRIDALFESFRKQIRTGLFVLPAPLQAQTAAQ